MNERAVCVETAGARVHTHLIVRQIQCLQVWCLADQLCHFIQFMQTIVAQIQTNQLNTAKAESDMNLNVTSFVISETDINVPAALLMDGEHCMCVCEMTLPQGCFPR